MTPRTPTIATLLACAIAAGFGCEQNLTVGSDVLWSALHESGTFQEWTNQTGGSAQAFPVPNNAIDVSTERAHGGTHSVKLTINAGAAGIQQTTELARAGGLPAEAYYSAWYYLPRSVNVGTYWVVFKFRMRTVATDSSTTQELYDLDLYNLPSGEMSVKLYDHRSGELPLDLATPTIPIGAWFQLEAYYRNASDRTGRVTYFLDGVPIVDIQGAMGPSSWVEWEACSIGEGLDPAQAVLFIDDAAISRTRVGPTGLIAAP
jgi:hypothetical protein